MYMIAYVGSALFLSPMPHPPGVERLFIVDFYLANPPLLYRSKMNQNTRRAFNELKIPRPEKNVF